MGNSWLGRIMVDRTVDHSGGIHHSGSHRVEAAHGSQITNFRPRRGLPREMGAGRWVGWVVMGWIENPSNQPVLPRLHRRHCNWIINVTECHSIRATKHLTMMIIFDPVGNSQMFPEEKEASHCPIPNVHFKLIVFIIDATPEIQMLPGGAQRKKRVTELQIFWTEEEHRLNKLD